jgi:multimeric flavodoxin WrbA
MQILAFNGSPRPKGNTSAIIASMLEGARSRGARTEEIRLHDIDFKGCLGCLGCRKNDGICSAKDDLSPYLEAIKTSQGIIVGCPIYMYRISGQMKLFVDRIYSLYASLPRGGYKSMVPRGKTYALVTSQGAPGPGQYEKSITYLAGMTGSGLGMEEVGRIIHTESEPKPAVSDQALMERAFDIGCKMVR